MSAPAHVLEEARVGYGGSREEARVRRKSGGRPGRIWRPGRSTGPGRWHAGACVVAHLATSRRHDAARPDAASMRPAAANRGAPVQSGPMSHPLVVMKFGGSSVANADRIRRVARRIARARADGADLCIVVSAMGDTTDELLALAAAITEEPDPRGRGRSCAQRGGFDRRSRRTNRRTS